MNFRAYKGYYLLMDFIRHARKTIPQLRSRIKTASRYLLYSLLSPDILDIQLTAARLDALGWHKARLTWLCEWLPARKQWRIAYRVQSTRANMLGIEADYEKARRVLHLAEFGRLKHVGRVIKRARKKQIENESPNGAS